MNAKTYPTNYQAAVRWLGGDLIQLFDHNHKLEYYEIWYPDTDETDYETLLEKEVFQAYLTNYSEDDALYLHEHFGLRFAYCEDLDLYILLVDHYGTAWDYVYWETDLEAAKCGLGEDPKAF